MRIQLIIVGLLATTSCSTKTDQRSPESNSRFNILYKKNALCNFSSSIKKDSFKIIVVGESFAKGDFGFQIKNDSGRLLFNETYPSISLLGYDFIKTDSTDTTDYMIRRIEGFFDQYHFIKPAISPDDKFNAKYSNKDIWNEIKSDKRAIGFRFLVGNRDGHQIVYSKRYGSAVLYFRCCE